MPAKHFVNDPTHLVASSLRSLSITNPAVAIDTENKIVYARRRSSQSKVSIISGGGSGHEPAFGGFVGAGLLAASVAGTIFASPSSKQVLAAIEGVDCSQGVLVTVMNYTGDVLNFGVAVEKAKARNPKMRVEMLVVGDDVGVPRSRAGKVGRRGIAGTVLVHKITGALAAAGFGLDEISRIGNLVSRNIVSIGVSLDRVHVPGRALGDVSDRSLGAEEVELGMGIHNEPGSGRRSGREAELPALVDEMLRQLLDADDKERGFLETRADKMVLLVNNLGALSALEFGAIVTEVADQLRKTYTIVPARVYAGTYMTSLGGPGFSVSLLNVVDTSLDTDILQLLDAPSEAVGWATAVKGETWDTEENAEVNGSSAPPQLEGAESSNVSCDIEATIRRLRAGLNAVIAAEPEVTRYDSIVGDGDCGTTLRRGAEGILKLLSTSPTDDVVTLLSMIASKVETTMDGTSGALYAIFMNALTQDFKLRSGPAAIADVEFWSLTLRNASAALAKYTPAKVGDRTLIDALEPFVKTLSSTGRLQDAASAAVAGAAKTREMRASLGRAVYVGEESEWRGKIPDPGAWGLGKFFEGLALSAE
ncbi:hypothetical protein H2199_009093 [Coniosporium tulheliwenetii]|uniref:Uncharacterized protein n=1 Tax=Coniosporium tulheliwenetii TaxID=3383036 RepID=A0ACC2YG92_9PEZI|nr:hypothetical protein H2199_009093 [Cladosporium sp. JES 115]